MKKYTLHICMIPIVYYSLALLKYSRSYQVLV